MANTFSGTLTVFFQTSAGTFDPDPTVLGGGQISDRLNQVEAADLNGDGLLDLVCASHDKPIPPGHGFLGVFLQTGPRQFQRTPDPDPSTPIHGPSTDVAATDVAVADLDGDGRIDLGSSNRPSDGQGGSSAGDHTITVHLQERDADGGFPEEPDLVLQDAGSIDFPASLVAADLNADGRLDLISANQESDNLTVFLRDPKGGFATTPDFALGETTVTEQPQHHEVVDLNGDGRLDVIAASLSSGRSVFLQSAPAVSIRSPISSWGRPHRRTRWRGSWPRT